MLFVIAFISTYTNTKQHQYITLPVNQITFPLILQLPQLSTWFHVLSAVNVYLKKVQQ